MQKRYSWIIVLAVVFLSIFQIKAQAPERDSVLIKNFIPENTNLQAQPVQPYLLPEIPYLWDRNNNFNTLPFNKRIPDFTFKQIVGLPYSLTKDSSLVYIPACPGLADYQNFGGALGSFNITNKLNLDYSAFISVQYGYLLSTRQIVFGGKYLLQYAITNKLKLETQGQYVTQGNNSDPVFKMHGIFPTTKFGTALHYSSNHKTKIKVGVDYQYDLNDKTWKPESGGKVLFKF